MDYYLFGIRFNSIDKLFFAGIIYLVVSGVTIKIPVEIIIDADPFAKNIKTRTPTHVLMWCAYNVLTVNFTLQSFTQNAWITNDYQHRLIWTVQTFHKQGTAKDNFNIECNYDYDNIYI